MNLSKLFLLLSMISPLIPVYFWRFSKQSAFLWYYSILSLSTEFFAYFIKKHNPQNSIAGNVFEIAEFILILLYYKNKVFKSNTLFFCIVITGLSFFIIHTTIETGWFKLNRIGISAFLIIYILLSISGFYTMLRQQKILFLEKSSFFWANVAIIIYSSGAFFLFLSTSHIKNSADRIALTQLWGTLFLSLNILKNILLGIALSKKEET